MCLSQLYFLSTQHTSKCVCVTALHQKEAGTRYKKHWKLSSITGKLSVTSHAAPGLMCHLWIAYKYWNALHLFPAGSLTRTLCLCHYNTRVRVELFFCVHWVSETPPQGSDEGKTEWAQELKCIFGRHVSLSHHHRPTADKKGEGKYS